MRLSPRVRKSMLLVSTRSNISATPARHAPQALGELVTIKVRYKAPDGDKSQLLTRVLMNQPSTMTGNIGFASAVAEFGMVLRESPSRGQASFQSARARARQFLGEDEEGIAGSSFAWSIVRRRCDGSEIDDC